MLYVDAGRHLFVRNDNVCVYSLSASYANVPLCFCSTVKLVAAENCSGPFNLATMLFTFLPPIASSVLFAAKFGLAGF